RRRPTHASGRPQRHPDGAAGTDDASDLLRGTNLSRTRDEHRGTSKVNSAERQGLWAAMIKRVRRQVNCPDRARNEEGTMKPAGENPSSRVNTSSPEPAGVGGPPKPSSDRLPRLAARALSLAVLTALSIACGASTTGGGAGSETNW